MLKTPNQDMFKTASCIMSKDNDMFGGNIVATKKFLLPASSTCQKSGLALCKISVLGYSFKFRGQS